MAFNIIFQRNNSETIKVTKDLTDLVTLNGVLRDGSSIINPVILVEGDLTALKATNYFTIPQFGRSYFLGNMVSVRAGLIEVSGHVDVLSSFAVDIKANKGIIYRQEEKWNLYLNDGVLEVYQNPIVTTHEFPNGFSGQSYVLALAGRRSGGSGGPGIIPGAGGSSDEAKTSRGLLEYAIAQLGNPYWFGTFGQIADQTLLNNRRASYPNYYTATDFPSQFGQRVHDCVGLIKGYRWSDTPTSAPVYNPAQDVSAQGLFAQCSTTFGAIGDTNWTTLYSTYPGICVFIRQLNPDTGKVEITHVGVSAGDGTVIEARGHAYGVVRTNLTDRPWTYWGMPDWLEDNTGVPYN